MKNALSRTLEDPALAGADVIPTSTMQLPEQEPVVPTQDLINDALSHRAELAESRIDLSSRELNNKAVRNAMLPTLALFAYYGGSGIGGDVNSAQLSPALHDYRCSPVKCFTPAASCSAVPQWRAGRLRLDVESACQSAAAPDKGVGLTLDHSDSKSARRRPTRCGPSWNIARRRSGCNNSRTRSALRCAMLSSRYNRIEPACKPPRLRSTLPAKRWTPSSRNWRLEFPIQQRFCRTNLGLTTAESNLVSAKAAYEKARVELDRATGLLLDHSGIVMADAERGAGHAHAERAVRRATCRRCARERLHRSRQVTERLR